MNDETTRISLRFRMENETDARTWELLEKIASERNASKNSVALDLIRLGAESLRNSEEAFAERIADMVADRIRKEFVTTTATNEAAVSMKPAEDNVINGVEAMRTDEPMILGEAVLDFLSNF